MAPTASSTIGDDAVNKLRLRDDRRDRIVAPVCYCPTRRGVDLVIRRETQQGWCQQLRSGSFALIAARSSFQLVPPGAIMSDQRRLNESLVEDQHDVHSVRLTRLHHGAIAIPVAQLGTGRHNLPSVYS